MNALRDWYLAHKPSITQGKIGKAIRCSQSHVSLILRGERQITAEHCPALEKLTGIPRERLRPDIFGGQG